MNAQLQVTYLEHSGFMVEYEDVVCIFDYYKGDIPSISVGTSVYVFASHAHQDHFNKKIFQLADQYEDVTYILSDDISVNAPKGETLHIGARKELELKHLHIQTLKSTDEGVAFFVQLKDKIIYHAGDLNWWHWEEEGDVYNEMMRRNYQSQISKIEGRHIDAAFVPLDPRQEEQYAWGLDYFMRHTDTTCVFPMHMWGQYQVCERLLQDEISEEYRGRVMVVERPSQQFCV